MAADWLLLGVEAERNRSVAFTGHQDYDGSADGILRAAVYRLWSEGFRFFLSGMACGFDLAAAEAVLALRGECAGMELVAVVPFAGQPDSFSDADKRRYADVLAAADRTVVLADSYSRGCYYRRNDYLVDHAVRVVAWYIRCSGAVPSYSSRSQNTKFISLSQHSPACRNLLFDFFYTLRHFPFGKCRFFIYKIKMIIYNWEIISLIICAALPTSALPFEFFIT